jgi:cobalt/nickel transport system permease protein
VISVPALSNHVPDPRLMTAMAEHHEGPFHRLSPWTKLGLLGALVVAVTVVNGVVPLVALYGAVLVAYVAANLPIRRLLGWYTLPALFVVSIGGPLLVMEPGTPIGPVLETPLGGLSVTWAGATLVVELAARSMTVVTFVLATMMTTTYADVATVLDRLLPSPIDQVALLTYRFTFVMLETLEDLVKAAQSRGATLSTFWANRRLYARMLGMTMLAAIERSERLVASMEARGYDGRIAMSSEIPRPPLVELAAIAVAYLLVVGYVLFAGGILA